MSGDIQRVPIVPFAQIANGALRDRRLSFRARGILAMVLSYPGDWSASRAWLEGMSERDGREAVQSALNELNEAGYRRVTREQMGAGRWRTVVLWCHEPPADGFPGGRLNRQSAEPSVLQNTITNTKDFDGRVSRPSDQQFQGWPGRADPPLPPEQQAEKARQLRHMITTARQGVAL